MYHKIFILSDNYLFKFLELFKDNNYTNNNYVKISFEPFRDVGKSINMFINNINEYRNSNINVSQAMQVIDIIKNNFSVDVILSKQLKIPNYLIKEYFHSDDISENNLKKMYLSSIDQIYLPDSIIFKDLCYFCDIIKILQEKDYISIDDRSNLCRIFIENIQSDLYYHDKIVDTINPAQYDILIDFCDHYIEDIVDHCMNLDSSSQIVGSINFVSVDKNIDLEIISLVTFIEAVQGDIATLIYEKFGSLKEKSDILRTLKKIYKGEANLESTYIRQGYGIPNIELQRDTLFDLIIKRIPNIQIKYGNHIENVKEKFRNDIRIRCLYNDFDNAKLKLCIFD